MEKRDDAPADMMWGRGLTGNPYTDDEAFERQRHQTTQRLKRHQARLRNKYKVIIPDEVLKELTVPSMVTIYKIIDDTMEGRDR
jgi:hypothetical protein